MRLRDVVAHVERVRRTSRKKEKVAILASLLRQAPPEDVARLALYLTGELRQGRIGVGWRGIESAAIAGHSVASGFAKLLALLFPQGKTLAVATAVVTLGVGAAVTTPYVTQVALDRGDAVGPAVPPVASPAVSEASSPPTAPEAVAPAQFVPAEGPSADSALTTAIQPAVTDADALEAPSLAEVHDTEGRAFRAFAEQTRSDLRALAAVVLAVAAYQSHASYRGSIERACRSRR